MDTKTSIMLGLSYGASNETLSRCLNISVEKVEEARIKYGDLLAERIKKVEQYQRLKAKYPEHLAVIRVGDVYKVPDLCREVTPTELDSFLKDQLKAGKPLLVCEPTNGDTQVPTERRLVNITGPEPIHT